MSRLIALVCGFLLLSTAAAAETSLSEILKAREAKAYAVAKANMLEEASYLSPEEAVSLIKSSTVMYSRGDAVVRLTPSKDAKIITEYGAGEKVLVVNEYELGDWRYVVLGLQRGFVHKYQLWYVWNS